MYIAYILKLGQDVFYYIHLHLVFIPVVRTQDKNGNNIDKIACSEFWKAKDSYIQLQNAFHSYITENGFDLERGKSSSREYLSVKDFKEITNYEKSKKTLEDIKIELPTVPDIKDFNKLMLGRDEKIQKEIIVFSIIPFRNIMHSNCDHNSDKLPYFYAMLLTFVFYVQTLLLIILG